MTLLLITAVFFLAYANGANDNFKGAATLLGSRTASYRNAISWATVTTFLGSIASFFFAKQLLKNFSGKGLVPDTVALSPEFVIAVGFAAALTVFLATLGGFPISTTHALTGALVGCGLVAVGTHINLTVLQRNFFLPLLLSPLLAAALAGFSYGLFRSIRMRTGVQKEYCLCVGQTEQVIVRPEPAGAMTWSTMAMPEIKLASPEECYERYAGQIAGIPCQKILDLAHYASAGMVSFARGLNDTPKIMALLFILQGRLAHQGFLWIGSAMALGGLLSARNVAQTMSYRITSFNSGQGFTANLVTALLVMTASRWGLPVSTTHAACGSLFGIGLMNGKAHGKMLAQIFLSWLLTLPLGALLGAVSYVFLKTHQGG